MLTHRGTQTIRTQRLTLRRFTVGDARAMFENWAGDDEVTRYLRFNTHHSAAETESYLTTMIPGYERPERYHWAIELADGELLGAVGAHIDEQDRRAEIAYCIGRAFWNRGYTTEAVAAVVRFLFTQVGVNRVEAYHSVNNPASGRVLEKAGLRCEGVSKQKYYCREGFQDCRLYGLIREDFFMTSEENTQENNTSDIVLQTERLLLRPFAEDDFEAVHSYASCPENVFYMVWGPDTEEQTRRFLRETIEKQKVNPRTDYDFAVVLKGTGRLVGGGGIYIEKNDRGQGMLGWILHRDYWKQGYCPEFGRELLRFGFEELRLHRIYATCNDENYGSYRVMEKIGMRREAHFLQNRHGRVGDTEKWYGEFYYAMLEEEWRASFC